MNLFIDIETLPSDEMPSLDEIKAPGNYKDPAKIQAYKEDNQIELWRKEALISHKGKILCLAYAVNDDEPTVLTGTELEIMTSFNDFLKGLDHTVHQILWVGHNVIFDLKFIKQRGWKFGLKEVARHTPSSRDKNIFDTMKVFTLDEYNNFISLDNCCKFLGIESSKGDLDGSKVFDYHQAGRDDEIYEYCAKDVSVSRKLYKALTI